MMTEPTNETGSETMDTLEKRKAAYDKFAARAQFVINVVIANGYVRNENGALVFKDDAEEAEFYEILAEYDDSVKHEELQQEADKLDAEAEANQGKQSLTDDE